jgi:formate dehydrogenase iron-sulfur subunit
MTPRRLKDIFWALALAGLVAVILRLFMGLGATTDLNDGVPWGLWKVLNMIAGVALATGGFVLAFCVHVLGVKSWKPLLRPALLVAFLGYGS